MGEYIKALPHRDPISFEKLYPKANPAAIDLLKKMLTFHPDKRISAAQALEHEYLVALHNVNDEPDSPKFDFPSEGKNVTEKELRQLIWAEMRKFHPNDVPATMPDSFNPKK